jgi:hypothetical protein
MPKGARLAFGAFRGLCPGFARSRRHWGCPSARRTCGLQQPLELREALSLQTIPASFRGCPTCCLRTGRSRRRARCEAPKRERFHPTRMLT